MRNRIVCWWGFALLIALFTAHPASAAGNVGSPFACSPSALAPAERKEHFDEVAPRLRKLRLGVRELPDGYEFAFPPDAATYQLLSKWMYQERLCCPFFDLTLRIDREGGPLWLRFTGRKGVKDFIRGEFPATWFRPGTIR